jgi:hypothetical protein
MPEAAIFLIDCRDDCGSLPTSRAATGGAGRKPAGGARTQRERSRPGCKPDIDPGGASIGIGRTGAAFGRDPEKSQVCRAKAGDAQWDDRVLLGTDAPRIALSDQAMYGCQPSR